MYHSFDQRIWFMVVRFLSKRSAFCPKYEFSLLNCHIFCPSCSYHGQNYEIYPTILVENCDQAICLGISIAFLYTTPDKVWLFEKFIFKLEVFSHNSNISSILVRQLKYFMKMVVTSARFTILHS